VRGARNATGARPDGGAGVARTDTTLAACPTDPCQDSTPACPLRHGPCPVARSARVPCAL